MQAYSCTTILSSTKGAAVQATILRSRGMNYINVSGSTQLQGASKVVIKVASQPPAATAVSKPVSLGGSSLTDSTAITSLTNILDGSQFAIDNMCARPQQGCSSLVPKFRAV